jgi:hypothetical protein
LIDGNKSSPMGRQTLKNSIFYKYVCPFGIYLSDLNDFMDLWVI